jgi:Tol biopolymer transport system component
MRLQGSIGVLVGFVLVLTVGCTSPAPEEEAGRCDTTPNEAEPRHGDAIVFIGGPFQRTGGELFSVNEDGSGLRQLTEDCTFKTALTVSPDGTELAYAAFPNELTREAPVPQLSSIYVIGADGTDRRTLCEACSRTAYGFGPNPHADNLSDPIFYAAPDALAWSPRGTIIATAAASPGVVLIDTETGETSTIPAPEPITAISWSPDGRQLALGHTRLSGLTVPREGTELAEQRVNAPGGGIYVLDVATGDLDEVISTAARPLLHGWSTDSDLIAYSHDGEEGQRGEIAVYSVSEDRSRLVVPGRRWHYVLGASWSPYGDRISALTVQGNEGQSEAKYLFVVSSDGGQLRDLPLCRFEGAFDGDSCIQDSIAWSPDGATVAYRAFINGSPIVSALILQDIDGSPPKIVSIDGPSFYIEDGGCCLAWLPAAA